MEAIINKIQELNLKNFNENYLFNNNISCGNINTMLNGKKQDKFLIKFNNFLLNYIIFQMVLLIKI